jgi:hypothetical protein
MEIEELENGECYSSPIATDNQPRFGKTESIGGTKEKRGRGRPRKNFTEDFRLDVIDCENLEAGEYNTPKPKTPKKLSQKKIDDTVTDFSNILLTITGITGALVSPVFIISENEAVSIAKPLTNILNRYNLLEKIASTSDVLTLVATLAIIFVPRTINYVKQKKQDKQDNQINTKIGGEKNDEIGKIERDKQNTDITSRDSDNTDVNRKISASEHNISTVKALSLETCRRY